MTLRLLLPLAFCFSLLAACATPSPRVAAPGLKRVWMVSEWPNIPREELLAAQARIDLTGLPRASAHMGCNRLMFHLAETDPLQAEGRLNIGPIAATRMHCPDRMHLEQTFSQQFPRFTRYRLAGHRLTLQDAEGRTIHLVAQDWD